MIWSLTLKDFKPILLVYIKYDHIDLIVLVFGDFEELKSRCHAIF